MESMAFGVETQSAAQKELEPGERLLWSARPDAVRQCRQAFALWLFAIPWTAFAIFWICGAADLLDGNPTPRAPDTFSRIFPLFGVPFVLIGLAMMMAPYWAYRKVKRTTYAVSDRRVLIIEEGRARTIKSYSADDIGNIERIERADGSGDLTFAQKRYRDSDGDARSTDIKFIGIPAVRSVENLLRDTFKQKTS